MASDPLFMVLVICVTIMLSAAVAWLTRSITFYGAQTDNHKQVLTAASVGNWRFPSDMHKVVEGGMRTRMKDGHVLGLVIMQWLLRDKESDYPTVILCLVVNSISAIFVYLLAADYWNPYVGLVIWGMFVSSLWTYQVAVFGTHICMANMFCLISVFMMQQMTSSNSWAEYFWALGGGMGLALCLFSSGSSRKYIPLIAAAFLFSQREVLWIPDLTLSLTQMWGDGVDILITGISVMLLIIPLVVRLVYKPMVSAAYDGRSIVSLNKIFKAKDMRDKEHYLAEVKERVNTMSCFMVLGAIYFLVSTIVARSNDFFTIQLCIIVGAALAVLILTIPNVFSNLSAYYVHSRGWKLNRFLDYAEFFEDRGTPLRKGMRGGGALWVIRFYFRMIPLTFSLYLLSFGILGGLLILGYVDKGAVANILVLVVVSISPVLVGELTRGVQSGRYYFPGFVSLFVIMGYTLFLAHSLINPSWEWIFWGLGALVIGSNFIITIKVFLGDVLPARMAPALLARTIQNMNIDDIYTYDTSYNDAFVRALPPEVLSRLRVNYITSINDVESGYIVIPGTSSKALNMESLNHIVKQGDFNGDEELERLISSRDISTYAIASFKTFGTSRIWHQEAEITTYRDLILKEVRDEDRWRGKAWILDARKLNEERHTRCSL